MTPNVCWLRQQEKYNTQPRNEAVEWKNLMTEILLETELPVKENEESKIKCLHLSPNIVMDARHAIAHSLCHSRTNSIPKEIIQTEAARSLREENRKQLLKRKQDMLVLKEIETLTNILEDYKLVKKKEEIINDCQKTAPKIKSYVKCDFGHIRKFEDFRKMGTWSRKFSSPTPTAPSLKEARISLDVAKRGKETEDPCSRPVSRNKKGSETNSEYESYIGKQYLNEFLKNEIMKRFFESQMSLEEPKIEVESFCDSKKNIQKDNKKITSDEQELKKAWKAWRMYTLASRKIRKEKIEHQNKIEKFLERLQAEPPAISRKNFTSKKPKTKSSQSKLKHKQILEKCDEKEKMAQDIMIKVEKSQEETHKCLVYFEKQNLERKEKVKVLKTLSNIKEGDGIKVFPYPKFLLRMEKRREELMSRRSAIRERKRKLEEERVLKEKQREEEMKVAIEQEKRNNIEKLREKRRLEKEKKQKEKEEREKSKLYSQLADEHYRRYLVRRFGIEPWLGLINLKSSQWRTAEEFDRNLCLKKALILWKETVRNRIKEKEQKANRLYSIGLQKRCFYVLCKAREEIVRKNQVAADWNDLKLVDRMFSAWVRFTRNEQIQFVDKIEIAESYYEKKLKSYYLEKWKTYPAVKRQEVAKEKRKQVWRKLVQEVLPDYRPGCIGIDS